VSPKWLSAHKNVAMRSAAALAQAHQYMAAHPGYLATILRKYTKVSCSSPSV